MDCKRRLGLIEQTRQQDISYEGTPLPVVSLEEFFTGNDDPGSIGCNTDHPGPEFFKEPLFAIRARPNVQDVAEEWARSKGCQEMASDCLLENELSLAAHLALGYEEKERLIHFGKSL